MNMPEIQHDTCSFAPSETYGHECGAPAMVVGLRETKLTHSGIYYARRCLKCSMIKGGENKGITKWEPFDATKHVNDWNGRY